MLLQSRAVTDKTTLFLLWWPSLGRVFGWVLGNVVGWSAGLFLSDVMRFLIYSVVDVDDTQLLLRALEGALVGVATGIVLVQLIRDVPSWPTESG